MDDDQINPCLLNTEDVSHLTNVLSSMNSQLGDNQAIIDSLLRLVDTVVAYPNPPASSLIDLTSNDQQTSDFESRQACIDRPKLKDESRIHARDSQSAPLEYLLESKYGLSSRDTFNDESELLRSDILRLQEIRAQKIEKNKQLLKVVREYEQAINCDILPEIRSRHLDRDFNDDREFVDYHYSGVKNAYKHYTYFIEETEKLKNVAQIGIERLFDIDEHLLPLYQRHLCLQKIQDSEESG